MATPKITLAQTVCAFADGVGALSMSGILGYTSTALISMRNDPHFNLTEEQGSWIGAIVPGMALVGSLIAGYFIEKFGRRFTSMIAAIPNFIAWYTIINSFHPEHVIAARFLSGLCLGVQQVSISVYVSETVHPKLRAVFSIIPALTAMAGFMLINIVGTMTDWRGMAWVGAMLCLPALLLLFFLPETPYFLLKSGNSTKCLETICWLKSSNSEAQVEFKELQQSVLSDKSKEKVSLSNMLQPPYRWPFSIAILLHVFQQTTGISAIMSFMSIIFEQSGSPTNPSTASLIMTVVNIVSIFIVGGLLGKYSNKMLITVSSLLMIVPLFILSIFLWIRETGSHFENSTSLWTDVPLICITIYTFGFSMGWAPLPWMFSGNGLPLKIRGSGAGVAIATNWLFNFLTTKTFSWGTSILGIHSIFFIYAILTIFGTIVMLFEMPETFGFTDSELENYYRDGYKKKRN